MILRDFQVSPSWLPPEERRELNRWLFPLYEAVRLDLRERRLKAPFQKILVSLVDARAHPDIRISSALSICEVSVPVDVESMLASHERLHTLIASAVCGLRAISDAEGFDTAELIRRLEQCGRSDPPCAHQFVKLARTHKHTIRCETWFVARPGRSAIEVRLFARNAEQTLEVSATDGPLYVEDDFPIRSARIRDDRYELLSVDREVLADVPILSTLRAG